jgi:hypothetical protein
MNNVSRLLKTLAVTALAAASMASQAALTVYTSRASFLAAVSAPGTDTFNDLAIGPLTDTLNRSAGAYTYVANGQLAGVADLLFGVGSASDVWLSLDESTGTIHMNNFSASASGIGGEFFASDKLGQFLAGQTITVVAQDSSGTLTQVLNNPTTSTFLGFVSTGPLVSLSVTAVQPTGADAWPTLNDLTIASAPIPAIPEPSTYALLALGLGGVGFMVWRRR